MADRVELVQGGMIWIKKKVVYYSLFQTVVLFRLFRNLKQLKQLEQLFCRFGNIYFFRISLKIGSYISYFRSCWVGSVI